SFSTDRTLEIAESLGAEVFQHEFVNQAQQFQWALDHCPIQTDWVMRMDADEYLEPDAQAEICSRLPLIEDGVDGVYLNRKKFFLGKWIRHGGIYPVIMLRIWRIGKGRVEQRWMDEHIVLNEHARTVRFSGNFVDDNLHGITAWVDKHNSYATREMVELLNNKYGLFEKDEAVTRFDDPQAKKKRALKDNVYSKMPPGFRAFLYFLYRYILRLGFLDGSKGFIFHFMQGFWYRLLVDTKIIEIEAKSNRDKLKIVHILEKEHGIRV
ncbi:MAG: glycosyltransferase family 2 protein, partial [Methanobacteriota archaeon]